MSRPAQAQTIQYAVMGEPEPRPDYGGLGSGRQPHLTEIEDYMWEFYQYNAAVSTGSVWDRPETESSTAAVSLRLGSPNCHHDEVY